MTPEQQLIVALAGIMGTAVTSVVVSWINRKKLDAIHVLVNSNLTAVITEVKTLRAALGAAGIADPTRPPPATP